MYEDKIASSTFPPLLFPIDINPPKKEMSRFLAKMTLEAIAYRFLKQDKWIEYLIDSDHFDPIRNYARYGTGEDWPYYQRRIFPAETLMKHAKKNEWVQVGFGHDLMLTSRKKPISILVIMVWNLQ